MLISFFSLEDPNKSSSKFPTEAREHGKTLQMLLQGQGDSAMCKMCAMQAWGLQVKFLQPQGKSGLVLTTDSWGGRGKRT